MATRSPLAPLGRARLMLACLVAALTAGTVLAPSSPLQASTALHTSTALASETDEGSASVAAGWLADQLVDGQRMQTSFGGESYDDQGLTADVVLALASAGVDEGAAAAATDWLAGSAITTAYIGDGDTSAFAGATAKLALLALVRGLDPTAWGEDEVDLIARLESRQQDDGRFSDLSSFGDFSNPIGQSLALIALQRAETATPSDQAVERLVAVQCGDGGFADSLDADPTTCLGAVDHTAFALQALVALGRPADAERRAAALDFLIGAINSDGGWGPTAGAFSNTNSTGLALQALAAADNDETLDTSDIEPARTAGTAYLMERQSGCASPVAERGALAFDASGFDASNAARATAQGIPGLAGVGLDTLDADQAVDASPTLECTRSGYWTVDESGAVSAWGEDTAPILDSGAVAPLAADARVVDVASDPLGRGLWVLDGSGAVHALGEAPDLGQPDLDSLDDGESASALAISPDGDGAWVFTTAGRVMTLGSAEPHGDLSEVSLNADVIDAVTTPSGQGYWLLGADGGVFTFGDAGFHGSTGDLTLNQPVVGMAPDPDGEGYWLVAADGGVFTFAADFAGSIPGVLGDTPLNAPIQGMVAYGNAYLMVGADGGVFNFATDLDFEGSDGASGSSRPVVAIAPAPPRR